VLCCVVLCCVALRCVVLCCVALRCVVLCCVVLCCVVLCCVVTERYSNKLVTDAEDQFATQAIRTAEQTLLLLPADQASRSLCNISSYLPTSQCLLAEDSILHYNSLVL
jgi:hypothetical protein